MLHHPNFYAYYPLGHSYPAILGELMNSGLGGLAFSWDSSPAFTELETIVLKWFAKATHLPVDLYNGQGGGVIQSSASECILVCLMTARDHAIHELKRGAGTVHESVFLPQLVAYTSSMAHSAIEKAAKMALVQIRILEADSHGRLDSDTLRKAIAQDLDNGLTPFFVLATVGTTGGCAFDNIEEIGQICKETPTIWYHVDGAYGGTTFILPEMRHFMKGLDLADSYNTNPSKFMLVSFDCCLMYVKDVKCLKAAMSVNPLRVEENTENESRIDYRDYGIPSGRRSRALKILFVFKTYGIEGIQRHMRNHKTLAKRFEQHVRNDKRFEVMNDVHLGLVCFRLMKVSIFITIHDWSEFNILSNSGSDQITRKLLTQIQLDGKYHMIPATLRDKYVIRFCLSYEHTNDTHIGKRNLNSKYN